MLFKRHDLLPSLSFFVLLALLVTGFFALSRQSVKVQVYDTRTGYLLPDALVENLTPARRQAAPLGWLFLKVNKQLLVNVSADGYLPAQALWRAAYPWVLQGRLNVFLSPAQLTGLVRDAETGLPLTGAEVWIGAARLVSDAAGAFQLSGAAGETSSSVKLDGYQPWQGEISWQDQLRGEPLLVELRPNKIYGLVRSHETGESLPGAMVTVAGQQTVTDSSGRFYLRRLRAGDTLAVELDGFWPVQVTYSGTPPDVTLRSDLVTGRVHWQETGEPLPGAVVTAANQNEIADSEGRFGLHRLQEGEIITITRAGFLPAAILYSSQAGELDIALQDRQARVKIVSDLEGVDLTGLQVKRNGQLLTPAASGLFSLRVCEDGEFLEAEAEGHWPAGVNLSASIGQNLEEIEISLRPRALTVTVVDDYAGWPLAGAWVASSPSQFTDALGRVVLLPAMPGMEIDIGQAGYVRQVVKYDGQLEELEIRLIPQNIRGLLIDATTGKPVPNAAFRRDRETLLRTGDDGSFNLEPDAWQTPFTVRVPGYRQTQVSFGQPSPALLPRLCPGAAPGSNPCWEIKIAPFEARGVYIPFGLLYSRQRTLDVLDMIAESDLNAVVVDVKGDRGLLAYESELPLAVELGVSLQGGMDIKEFLEICRQKDIYAIARLVVFKDNPLAHGRTELAVKQADDTVWLDREELGWANPYLEQVWDYNIGIAQEVAQLGFDEIQLDYLRFPSDGDLDKIVYQERDTPETKTTAIRTFLSRMRESLAPHGIFLSADLFGLTLVVDPASDLGIGQRVIDIAPYVDYLCPMLYPSTFISGNMGIDNPSLHPYKVVAESLAQGMARTPTLMRPWLQAYSLKGVTYGLTRQTKQRWAAEAAGSCGWTFWNAGGRYDEQVFNRINDGLDSVIYGRRQSE